MLGEILDILNSRCVMIDLFTIDGSELEASSLPYVSGAHMVDSHFRLAYGKLEPFSITPWCKSSLPHLYLGHLPSVSKDTPRPRYGEERSGRNVRLELVSLHPCRFLLTMAIYAAYPHCGQGVSYPKRKCGSRFAKSEWSRNDTELQGQCLEPCFDNSWRLPSAWICHDSSRGIGKYKCGGRRYPIFAR